MFNINNKEELILKIQAAIECAYIANYHTDSYRSFQNIDDFVKTTAQEAAKHYAKQMSKELARQIITSLYTHDEFEKDLGLK